MSTSDAVLMDHEHGVANNRCTHDDCQSAFARWTKRYKFEQQMGIPRTADAELARDHLARLEGAGWSRRAIAGGAGMSPAAVSRIALGQRTIRVPILNRLLELDPASLPLRPGGNSAYVFVPRIGTVRRIQALLALGWTHTHVIEASGVNTRVLLSQQGRWVARPTHDKIAAAYRTLAGRAGPSAHTRGRAARLGYLTPAAWDDIDLDPEPDLGDGTEDDGSIDEVAILRRMHGDKTVPLTQAERFELVRRARAAGWTYVELEERAGVTKPDRYLDAPEEQAS